MTVANLSEGEFFTNLFKETRFNTTQDIVMDALGLVLFFSIYKKRSKKIKEYETN